jgi:enamine deaminase RidA (YjgF/YER057c/UK114 family)
MARRKSINYPGFKHENPIPNASRIGNILMSSIISGRDPETGKMPPELDAQVTNVFRQIRLCVEAAGGTVEDIVKVNFWMKDPATGRKALNGEWSTMFPDPESRPARHTLALGAGNPNHVTCDFVAVIGG